MVNAMRTTLQVDDDVFQAAKTLARSQRRSIGKVLSELARRGLQPAGKQTVHQGFPVFSVDANASPVCDDDIKAALDDEL